MSTATQDPTEVAEPAEPAWRRLSPRLIPVHLAWLVPPWSRPPAPCSAPAVGSTCKR